MQSPPLGRETVAAYLERLAAPTTATHLQRYFSESAVLRSTRSGRVERVLPRIYAAALHARSFHIRAEAAVLWSGGVVAGPSALFLWGLLDDAPDRVHLLAAQKARPRAPDWIELRRVVELPPTAPRGGIAVAAIAFALIHGYSACLPGVRDDVIYRAVREGIVSSTQLRKALVASARVAKRSELARVILAVERGAHSPLEAHAMRHVFARDEFQHLLRQHEVVIEGRPFRLDMFDPASRTAIEADGANFHWTRDKWQLAIERDVMLASRGIQTVRLSYRDLHERPDWCRRMVQEVLVTRLQRR